MRGQVYRAPYHWVAHGLLRIMNTFVILVHNFTAGVVRIWG